MAYSVQDGEPEQTLGLRRQQQVDAPALLEVHSEALLVVDGDLRLERRAEDDRGHVVERGLLVPPLLRHVLRHVDRPRLEVQPDEPPVVDRLVGELLKHLAAREHCRVQVEVLLQLALPLGRDWRKLLPTHCSRRLATLFNKESEVLYINDESSRKEGSLLSPEEAKISSFESNQRNSCPYKPPLQYIIDRINQV